MPQNAFRWSFHAAFESTRSPALWMVCFPRSIVLLCCPLYFKEDSLLMIMIRSAVCMGLLLCMPALSSPAAERPAKALLPGAVAAQPAVESIDLSMYTRSREEGLEHSHIMEYAPAHADDIGPRLTGSPNPAKANAWTRDQLTAMGCVNAHRDDWGGFGMGWQQLNTWARMTSPDTAVFVAQARRRFSKSA